MKKEFSTLSQAVKTALFAGLMVSTAAVAAETPDKEKKSKKIDSEQIETIEVQGFRGSLQKNLNTKRFSNTVVDAITAEDIGKFPDQTTADALQRVAGVQVEKSSGESDRVSIRGTAPHLNLTLLNGQNVASATASSAILSSSRGFNYSLLPAELVDSLEVHKSPQAKISEGSVGGTVIVKTRRPLSTESNTSVLTVKDIYQEDSGEHSPLMSGFYSWKNEDENFGFNVSAVMKNNRLQRDGINSAFSKDVDSGYYMPNDVRASRFNSESDLTTYAATLEFAPTDDLHITFNNMISSVDKDNSSLRNGVWVRNQYAELEDPTYSGGIVDGGSLAPTEEYKKDFSEMRYGATKEKGSYESKVHDLKIEYTFDDVTWTTQLGYTEADGKIHDNQLDAEAQADISYKLTSDSMDFWVDPEIAPEDYVGVYMSNRTIHNEEEETYLQTDFNIVLDHDFISSIDVGAKYSDHFKGSGLHQKVWHPLDVATIKLSEMADGSVASDFRHNGASTLYEFDFDKLSQWQDKTPMLREYDRAEFNLDLTEKVTNAYVQANFEYDDFRGNIGVRYAKTEQISKDNLVQQVYSWNPDSWILTPVTTKREYEDILPSFNLSYNVQDDFIVRFAAAKVMARPDYDNLSARTIYSKWSGIEGNPELDPTEADQYDLSLEYYFAEASILSVAFFYKDISSYIETRTTYKTLPDTANPGEIFENVAIKQPINGEGGTNEGIELNVQHDFGMGFGALLNYTYQEAEVEGENGESTELPNNSKDTFNMTGYYENADFSARLSYSYRSDYYTGSATGDLTYWNEAYGQLDANFSYDITENATLSLQFLNLNDEALQSTVKVGDASIRSGDRNYGRRVFTGLTAKF